MKRNKQKKMRKGRKQTNRKIQKKDEDTIQDWKKRKTEKE